MNGSKQKGMNMSLLTMFKKSKPDSAKKKTDEETSHAQIMEVMGALMVVMLLAALNQTIVATALPQIAIDLNALDQLSWVVTAFLIASAIATPIYGKLGDMYGRKKILNIAIIMFLVGSLLAGISQDMNQLIGARAVQGLGGGGIMATVLAIIGDLVPPRQRGRYQGYFAAVFAISSVAGPLLGGLFTEHLGWHWIFFFNLPLGLLALFVIDRTLHLPKRHSPHKVDYLGAVLLSVSTISILLLSVWGGTEYDWNSPQIYGLGIAGLVFAGLFVWRERYAVEPIIPLKLFKSDIFNVSVLLTVLSGIAMFASILYIPQYQQIVRGNSPTESGLLMLPLVVGVFISSIVSGRLIAKTGKYKLYPIIGTLVLALGLWLFSNLGLDTSHVTLSVWMVVVGLGLGLFMQIPTLAVQNSASRADLGSATSTVTFFRSVGGSLGGAVFGTILISRLTYHIEQSFPGAAGVAGNAASSGLANLPPEYKQAVLGSYVSAFQDMFIYAIPFALAAFAVALFLRETPLRNSAKEMADGEGLHVRHSND